jgi:hypothetical protein
MEHFQLLIRSGKGWRSRSRTLRTRSARQAPFYENLNHYQSAVVNCGYALIRTQACAFFRTQVLRVRRRGFGGPSWNRG